MAARYSQSPVDITIQNSRHVSITGLERALEVLTQQVAERKRQLSDTFRQIHQIVAQREVALLAELDAIPAEIKAIIQERRDSLEQLTKNRDDTERELNTNKLNEFLQKQLKNIEEEIETILSEQISFPHVSINCQMEEIGRTLEEKCHIMKISNPYAGRTLPIWHRVKEFIECPAAICIDPTSQLIYLAEDSRVEEIQVFTSEGNHDSTLRNPRMSYCDNIKIHKDHIYLTSSINTHFFKLNKKGEIVKYLKINTPLCGLFIEGSNIYTCLVGSPTVQIFDLNLKPTKKIILKAISFNEDTTPRDIILHKQQMFILFRDHNCHPDPIQVFKLDGTLIRSLVTGNNIKNAQYFCLDSYENFLVSDREGDCIRIFTPEGILIQKIGGDGENRELWEPRGIAMDSKQRILIVNKIGDKLFHAY